HRARRDEDRQDAGVLVEVAHDAEGAVVVRTVDRDVLEERVALALVDGADRWEDRAVDRERPSVRPGERRPADLAVPDERDLRVALWVDALEEVVAEDGADLHDADGILFRAAHAEDRADHQTLGLVVEDPRLLRAGPREREELGPERLSPLHVLRAREVDAVRVGDVHDVHAKTRLLRDQEALQPGRVASLGELAR